MITMANARNLADMFVARARTAHLHPIPELYLPRRKTVLRLTGALLRAIERARDNGLSTAHYWDRIEALRTVRSR